MRDRTMAVATAIAGISLGVLVLAMVARPLGLGGPSVPAGASVPAPYPPPGPSSGPHLNFSECEADDSNSTLDSGIAHLYEGNGNASGSGSGLINQGPPGFSAYPTESVAESNVITGWLSICESTAFYNLTQANGPQNNTWNGLAQNATGVYEFVFEAYWPAPASDCGSAPNANSDCTGGEIWSVNVASGWLTGPRTTYFAPGVGI